MLTRLVRRCLWYHIHGLERSCYSPLWIACRFNDFLRVQDARLSKISSAEAQGGVLQLYLMCMIHYTNKSLLAFSSLICMLAFMLRATWFILLGAIFSSCWCGTTHMIFNICRSRLQAARSAMTVSSSETALLKSSYILYPNRNCFPPS